MIDISNNLPPAPEPQLVLVRDAAQFPGAPDLRGFGGEPGKLESRTLFGMWEQHDTTALAAAGWLNGFKPDVRPRKLMSYNPQILNLGADDFEVGTYPSPMFARGFAFPTAASRLLFTVELETSQGKITAHPPVTFHWSGWYPSPEMKPKRQWTWTHYFLEYGLAAVPIGDPIVANNWVDVTGIGEEGPELCTFRAILDPINTLNARQIIQFPLRLDSLQAEIVW